VYVILRKGGIQDGCRIRVKQSRGTKTKGLGATLSRNKVICIIIKSIGYR